MFPAFFVSNKAARDGVVLHLLLLVQNNAGFGRKAGKKFVPFICQVKRKFEKIQKDICNELYKKNTYILPYVDCAKKHRIIELSMKVLWQYYTF